VNPNSTVAKVYSSNSTLRLRDAISVKKDLDFVADALRELKKRSEVDTIAIALWNSSLVGFFKCFAGGARKYQLDSKLFSHLPGQPVEFWNVLKDWRDKHIAHSISQLEDTVFGASINQETQRFVGIASISRKLVGPELRDIEQFEILVKISIESTTVEIQNLNKVVGAELQRIPFEVMNSWQELQLSIPNISHVAGKSRAQSKKT
jgi:hypothetical protein